MFKLLKRIKEKKRAEMEVSKWKADLQLAGTTIMMTQKYCPIKNGRCSTGCIHFKHGDARAIRDVNGIAMPYVNPPVCKLWK